MNATDMTTIQTQVPTRLLVEVEALVKAGWFRDADDLFIEALRRYLDSHQPALSERFMQADVDWGLRGRD